MSIPATGMYGVWSAFFGLDTFNTAFIFLVYINSLCGKGQAKAEIIIANPLVF